MKIGVVFPEELMEDTCSYIAKEFPEEQLVPFPYHFISELPDVLQGHQNRADAFLFLGETARFYASREIRPAIPWETIPRSASSLLRLFVQACRSGYDLRIATDMHEPEVFRRAFREAGLTPQDASVSFVPPLPYTDHFIAADAEALEKRILSGESAFCMTIFYRVYYMLQKRHIPIYMMLPSYEDISQAVSRLIMACRLKVSRGSCVTVLAVHTDMPGTENTLYSDYEQAMKQLEVTRCVYEFSHHIQAACVDSPPREYLIFSTHSQVEQELEHFQTLSLLQAVQRRTSCTLSVGIGYGGTAAAACAHAKKAMYEAVRRGGSRACLCDMSGQSVKALPAGDAVPADAALDIRLSEISRRTGISLRILSLLCSICQEQGHSRFTAAELADASSVSRRTINRILLKLMDAGYCQEVGKSFLHPSGRPSRILDLRLLP